MNAIPPSTRKNAEKILAKARTRTHMQVLEGVPAEDIGPKKVTLFRAMQFLRLLGDSLPVCMILPYNYQQLADLEPPIEF